MRRSIAAGLGVLIAAAALGYTASATLFPAGITVTGGLTSVQALTATSATVSGAVKGASGAYTGTVYADGGFAAGNGAFAGSSVSVSGAVSAASEALTGSGYADGGYSAGSGGLASASSLNKGSITVNGGGGTATVRSGGVCACTNAFASGNAPACSVSDTTLTLSGEAAAADGGLVSYVCL